MGKPIWKNAKISSSFSPWSCRWSKFWCVYWVYPWVYDCRSMLRIENSERKKAHSSCKFFRRKTSSLFRSHFHRNNLVQSMNLFNPPIDRPRDLEKEIDSRSFSLSVVMWTTLRWREKSSTSRTGCYNWYMRVPCLPPSSARCCINVMPNKENQTDTMWNNLLCFWLNVSTEEKNDWRQLFADENKQSTAGKDAVSSRFDLVDPFVKAAPSMIAFPNRPRAAKLLTRRWIHLWANLIAC